MTSPHLSCRLSAGTPVWHRTAEVVDCHRSVAADCPRSPTSGQLCTLTTHKIQFRIKCTKATVQFNSISLKVNEIFFQCTCTTDMWQLFISTNRFFSLKERQQETFQQQAFLVPHKVFSNPNKKFSFVWE